MLTGVTPLCLMTTPGMYSRGSVSTSRSYVPVRYSCELFIGWAFSVAVSPCLRTMHATGNSAVTAPSIFNSKRPCPATNAITLCCPGSMVTFSFTLGGTVCATMR